ncbi:MAG: response regulator [Halopseudomonas sp.]
MNNPVPWRILVVDDEEGVHGITRMIFRGYRFEERPVELISAMSGAEARALLQEQPDICLALLDVVMESDDEGLRLVEHIRNELGNQDIRIILRTGHPGLAPETDVIVKYDLNDYLSKSELSASRLLSSVVVALRSYRDICQARYQPQPAAPSQQSNNNLIGPVASPLLQQNSQQLARLQQLELSPMARDLLQELHCNQLRLQSMLQQLESTAETSFEATQPQPTSPRQLIETLIGDLLPLARQQRRLLDYQCATTLPEQLMLPGNSCSQLWLALLDHCLSTEAGPDLRLKLDYAPLRQQLELTIEGEQSQLEATRNSARQALWDAAGRAYCDSLAQRLGGNISVLADAPDKVLINCWVSASELAG